MPESQETDIGEISELDTTITAEMTELDEAMMLIHNVACLLMAANNDGSLGDIVGQVHSLYQMHEMEDVWSEAEADILDLAEIQNLQSSESQESYEPTDSKPE
jgi:hypothetical protein